MMSMVRRFVAVAAVPLVLAACGSDEPTGPTTPDPEITTITLEDGFVGELYEEGINASGGGGDYSWRRTAGTLPPGLVLSVEDLVENGVLLTGTPEIPGFYEFWLEVSVPDGRADTSRFTVWVLPPLDALPDTLDLAPGLVTAQYTVQLNVPGADPSTYDFDIVEGQLPDGLTLSASGRFDGAPTTPDTTVFTVVATQGAEVYEQTYRLSVVENDRTRYNITIMPVVPVPPELMDNLQEAVRRWEEAIVSDLGSVRFPDEYFRPTSCAGFGERVNGASADDILMLVNIDSIDGPGDPSGNVLAQAGPCSLRSSSLLPEAGILILDEYDLESYSEETATDIIQHEMAHVLGFGTLWDPNWFGLVEDRDSTASFDYHYLGEQAIAEYVAAGGDEETIPVESTAGEGSRGSHWAEDVFGPELMTPSAERSGTEMFVSRMTIASLADMGYDVNLDAAEDFPLFPASLMALTAESATGEPHGAGFDIVGGVGPVQINPTSGHP